MGAPNSVANLSDGPPMDRARAGALAPLPDPPTWGPPLGDERIRPPLPEVLGPNVLLRAKVRSDKIR